MKRTDKVNLEEKNPGRLRAGAAALTKLDQLSMQSSSSAIKVRATVRTLAHKER